MDTSFVFDILQFANCDFVIVDNSLHIIDSNNSSYVNKNIKEIFPYSIVGDDIRNYFEKLTNDNPTIIIDVPDKYIPYSFSLHKIKFNKRDVLLIVPKFNQKIPHIMKKIYEDLYQLQVFDEDADHFADVFNYILDTTLRVTGMDCGGIYIIDPLT
ncbi:MAG: hypothetical protein GYA16_03265, partial [Spirochaetes bacterium]|nr:hypothetical protein [Spirochaetota bacterium]